MQFKSTLLLTCLFFMSGMAVAANYPCSGSKGGVSHCAGADFVCNDGSISASKKICSMDTTQRLVPKKKDDGGDCSCRSHQYCTGPRGGQYCLDDAGKKSYRQR